MKKPTTYFGLTGDASAAKRGSVARVADAPSAPGGRPSVPASQRRPALTSGADENGSRTLQSTLGAFDAAGHAVQHRLERLRLDMVGPHHRLDQRIREEVVEGRMVAKRHGAPFRFDGQGLAAAADAHIDFWRRGVLLVGNKH
jgi:hypothetical protein